ncbi:enoyl-CoA hydratase-related protein [Streptomyces sp. TRM 70361]|uniref:enoyl-CoA hydratase/isomerase family protein n=1 Tax=Streptomyces sp. TRM 70361 TaxID=3116553 RepID=UPI002E7B4DBD|nr:enoyl-CoA hydratase-related protein [Streptomyces sp. TRM 70361]MEE1942796.1 enoyl-CoA hydratase-related protein [Streptomyces sp. TRM 70361]
MTQTAAEPSVRSGPLTVETHEGIAKLTLNRPDRRNGINQELGAELLRAVVDAARDDTVRVIVLTGSGPAFCAGDDIESLRELMAGNHARAASFPGSRDSYYLRVCEEILRAPKPVIAGLNGAAVGAGTEIACAADYRLASSEARIGSCLSRLGHVGNAVLLPRVVGPARATEIFLTGRLVGAAEAERIGLVDRVVPAEDFASELENLAAALGSGPTRAFGMFKELRDRAWQAPAEFGLRLQDAYHAKCLDGYHDGREGPHAYLERRPPRFTGR